MKMTNEAELMTDGVIEKQRIILEQWKQMISIADKNSDRRIKSNNTYITVNTLITAGTNVISGAPTKVLALIGMFISLLWFFSVLNYRLTNKYRYQVIRELEKHMFYQPITDEYQKLNQLRFYLGNTIIELVIPIVFIIVFFTMLI